MNSTVKNYLELIRLPGMFSAHADIICGFLVAGAGSEKLPALFWLLSASSCFLSAGMALNDYFDHEIDRKERPSRVIPSGRISRRAALLTGISLLTGGIVFAGLAGFFPFCISLLLTCTILLYDGLLKNTVAGPVAMGACRYLNLLMGLSVIPFDGWLLIPLLTGMYITGVTILSTKEAEGGRQAFAVGGCAVLAGLVPFVMFFLFLVDIIPIPGLICVLLGFALMTGLTTKILQLMVHHTPGDFQKTMKILLLSLIALDAVIASGFAPLYLSGCILLLYVPAFYSVRLFKVT